MTMQEQSHRLYKLFERSGCRKPAPKNGPCEEARGWMLVVRFIMIETAFLKHGGQIGTAFGMSVMFDVITYIEQEGRIMEQL